MSDVKVQDLPPEPFFARYLEDQFTRPLTEGEMKAVRGGSSAVEQDLVVNKVMADPPEWGGWPFPNNMPPGLPPGWPTGGHSGGPAGPCGPAQPTTMVFPSDTVAA
jgi:hypothetical protein